MFAVNARPKMESLAAVWEIPELPRFPQPDRRHLIVLLGGDLPSYELLRSEMLELQTSTRSRIRGSFSIEIISIERPDCLVSARIDPFGTTSTEYHRPYSVSMVKAKISALINQAIARAPSDRTRTLAIYLHGNPGWLDAWPHDLGSVCRRLMPDFFSTLSLRRSGVMFLSCGAAADAFPPWMENSAIRGRALHNRDSMVRAPLIYSDAAWSAGFTGSCESMAVSRRVAGVSMSPTFI